MEIEAAKQTEQAVDIGETKTKGTEGELVVAWWNGGGKLEPRLNVNPELQKFIAKGPDT